MTRYGLLPKGIRLEDNAKDKAALSGKTEVYRAVPPEGLATAAGSPAPSTPADRYRVLAQATSASAQQPQETVQRESSGMGGTGGLGGGMLGGGLAAGRTEVMARAKAVLTPVPGASLPATTSDDRKLELGFQAAASAPPPQSPPPAQVPGLGNLPILGRAFRRAQADVADQAAAGAAPPRAGAVTGVVAEQPATDNGAVELSKKLATQNSMAFDADAAQPPTGPSAPAVQPVKGRAAGASPESRLGRSGDVTLGDNAAETDSLSERADEARRVPSAPPVPQPETVTRDQPFSTFSLNVSGASFELAAASLEHGALPDPASLRSEEFLNAFDYHDPDAPPGARVGFNWEMARDPFTQNRDLVRFAVRTAARGREPGRPLNLVLLLDNSGSMERADRVRIIHEALRVLVPQLQATDQISVVAFARTAHLWVDGLSGAQASQLVEQVGNLTPGGGTNLGDALDLAYATALRHYLSQGNNRVVLLTDGAANLGDVDPDSLQRKVESYRLRGIALDCFGIGWEGYNDDLLEVLSRHGNGRYGFLNSPEDAAQGFAAQLAGALQAAAADVKVQVEFNPRRVIAYRQIGYAKHQLTKEQFRDNTVVAAQLGAAEAGNALYVLQLNPQGEGEIGWVRVRYRLPGTEEVAEHEWPLVYAGTPPPLDQASPALRLAAVAAGFAEWLAGSPSAAAITPDQLLAALRGVPEAFGLDPRPKRLESMLRQAQSLRSR